MKGKFKIMVYLFSQVFKQCNSLNLCAETIHCLRNSRTGTAEHISCPFKKHPNFDAKFIGLHWHELLKRQPAIKFHPQKHL